MARPHQDAYELTDAEKRDLIKLINEGKPIPEKFRFLLFDDKREVELVWNGKSREVCTAILPFQTLEHIDEPRKEKRDDEEFSFDTRGRQLKGWTNKLIWGDNKLILSSLKSGALRRQIEDAGGLKLIYIDPPFDVGADFSMDIEIGGETFHKEPNLLEQIAYRDTWGRGTDSFIAMIYERLILMRDLMHSEGSIYVHCDWRVNAFMRAVLNEIFGADNFVSEIVWRRSSSTGSSKALSNKFPSNHDTILFFSKDRQRYVYQRQYIPYSEEYLKRFKHDDGDGKGLYRISDLNTYSQATLAKLKAENALVEPTSPGANYGYKRHLTETQGVVVDDVWADINFVNPMATEGTGYSTQKPEALLERVMLASSNPDDLVADFFGGSGTTAAVAEKLGRKWITTDLGKFGIHTTRKRLIQVQRELKSEGKPFRAFEVLNLGRYERQAYLNVGSRLSAKKKTEALAKKEREFRDLILKAYRAEPLPDAGFFHGKNGGRLVVVGPINLPVGRLFVEEVVTECRKRGATRVDLLAFEFEMGLFPAVLDEAKQKGIDLAPKTIPPEVFDKRAVEKGQVRFHDVAYIEVTPRFGGRRRGDESQTSSPEKKSQSLLTSSPTKDELTVAVELTDFSVYYSQGLAEAITADLKEGKSEVLCEQGQLYKVSKNKEGVIEKKRLTERWTDWVDYWAVDFDYESRKEIIKVERGTGVSGVQGDLSGLSPAQRALELQAQDFEERWTGAYIFENEWQSFRTRQSRELEMTTASHTYEKPGRYIIAVKVIDIFGNDTMTLVPITVG
jgi:adenine-specific DNA-methyltransferase